ncbi:Zn-ribbon domain-containing OB-fold protein [Streptomyces sp. NPDC058417]|uniref:Zn-ribbon domain-containing OB-fold protein n=1 Tax=unclassified Streptomyces TaxID=2593676 RepID=UPI00365C2A1B
MARARGATVGANGPTGGRESTGGARHDVPEADAFTRTYWEAAAEGRLLVRRCGACGRAHHYPREFCPYCWSEDVRWETASGRARLCTWSVVHRNDLPPFGERTPYVAAVVDLAGGATEVVGGAGAAAASASAGTLGSVLRAGMELEVAFREGVPVFRPRGTGGVE